MRQTRCLCRCQVVDVSACDRTRQGGFHATSMVGRGCWSSHVVPEHPPHGPLMSLVSFAPLVSCETSHQVLQRRPPPRQHQPSRHHRALRLPGVPRSRRPAISVRVYSPIPSRTTSYFISVRLGTHSTTSALDMPESTRAFLQRRRSSAGRPSPRKSMLYGHVCLGRQRASH
jgi:hypothetical protein